MNTIFDLFFALCATVGLLTLAWLFCGFFLLPLTKRQHGAPPVVAIIPAAGSGASLEQDLRGLFWLRGSDVLQLKILIADAGLDEEGWRLTKALLAKHPEVSLCPEGHTESLLL